MSTLYKNKVYQNNGFHAAGCFPLDDREIINSIEDLYINDDTRSVAAAKEGFSLFNLVYPGLTVKYKDEETGKFHALTCNDNTPYLPGSVIEVNEDNIFEYWSDDSFSFGDDLEEWMFVVDSSIDWLIQEIENNEHTAAEGMLAINASLNELYLKVDSLIPALDSSTYSFAAPEDVESVVVVEEGIDCTPLFSANEGEETEIEYAALESEKLYTFIDREKVECKLYPMVSENGIKWTVSYAFFKSENDFNKGTLRRVAVAVEKTENGKVKVIKK